MKKYKLEEIICPSDNTKELELCLKKIVAEIFNSNIFLPEEETQDTGISITDRPNA